MVPLDLRDKLYRLFLTGLDSKKDPDWDQFSAKAAPTQLEYLLDRIPRYQAVLEIWRSKPRKQRSAIEEALALSELLFNQGLFFDCHEYLESAWKSSPEPWKTCFQGLIQIAAGFHKLELNPDAKAGALELLEKGIAKLKKLKPALDPETIQQISDRLEAPRNAISSGQFKIAAVPRLSWTPRSGTSH